MQIASGCLVYDVDQFNFVFVFSAFNGHVIKLRVNHLVDFVLFIT